MHEKPFIHLFETSEGKYCYDVNTDCILKVSETEYSYLKEVRGSNKDILPEPPTIELLKKHGYLKADKVQKTEHPDTHLLKYHCANKVEGIILQVTQNCNLRCEYCAYSGGYKNRVHTNKRMSKETALQAIDFLIDHSKDCSQINIGFYGGEPLLEFDLIKECVNYSIERIEGKIIHFSLTTNGTLLTEEVMDFFVKHKVLLTISLDGPEEVHDKNRKFANSEKGSFAVVMNNLRKLQKKYPVYFKKNVSYNAVLETENYNIVQDFFDNTPIFKNAALMPTLVTDVNSNKEIKKSEQFLIENQYSYFLTCLHIAERLSKKKTSNFESSQIISLGQSRKGKIGRQRWKLPEKWHHGGPCIPGIMRLFIDVDGNFYPCEKVSEQCTAMRIGNLTDGYDLERVNQLLNVEKRRNGKCFNCWAYSECKMCIGSISIDDTEEELDKKYAAMRIRVEEEFKDYCVLKSLGIDFEMGLLDEAI